MRCRPGEGHPPCHAGNRTAVRAHWTVLAQDRDRQWREGVDSEMLGLIPKGPQSGDGDLTPEQVAKDALAGIEQETFVILPHPQVLGYMRKKTENYDRWIAGMAKIQAKMREAYGK